MTGTAAFKRLLAAAAAVSAASAFAAFAQSETASLQKAIDDASAAGGGRVTVAAGVHDCGTLRLKSGVELHLAEGAVLRGGAKSDDYDDVPDSEGIRPEGSDKAFIVADGAENIAVTGGGVIDGRGTEFFDRSTVLWGYWWKKPPCPRPRLLQFNRCRGVRLEGVTCRDPANWTMWLRLCTNVTVKALCIDAVPKITNSDGIDFDGCRHVRVSGCRFSCGDDCIALRAMKGTAGFPVVCEDIVVENCEFESSFHAVRIGCPSDDTVRDAVFRNIKFRGRTAVVAQQPDRYVDKRIGGNLVTANLVFENWTALCYGNPLQIWVADGLKLRDFGHMTFRNFTFTAGLPLIVRGCAETTVKDVVFENVVGATADATPLEIKKVSGLEMNGVHVSSDSPSAPTMEQLLARWKNWKD
ncbi:MAG: hypothetical protein J6T01_01110 [Kiritimatiellae bacterium]|nr:hypothetical protein [Kiritimatiellia bacterium]